MKNYVFLAVGLLLLLFTSGCGAKDLPAVMFIPKNIDSSKEPATTASLHEIIVTKEKDVEKHLNEENFKIALSQTLTRANIFGGDEKNPLSMTVTVYKASIPSAGFTMTGCLGAHYKISHEGNVIFDEDVYYETSAGVSDAFLGSARALLVFQNTNQGHMDLLLQKLRTKFRDTLPEISAK